MIVTRLTSQLWKVPIMTKILIPYGTTEGQTAKIAEFIADVIRGHGDEVGSGRHQRQYRTRFPTAMTA